MAGPKATARLPALRRPVPASDLDVFLSALGALTWRLGCNFRVSGKLNRATLLVFANVSAGWGVQNWHLPTLAPGSPHSDTNSSK